MKEIIGKLDMHALPVHEPIALGAACFMLGLAVAVMILLTLTKRWGWLWHDWLTSVDHKKIGIMYILLAVVMLFRGFADALMMRAQQAVSVGSNMGYLNAHHYAQIFTAHGVIMIFFMAMPFMFGLINIVLPLQIGARDVAYPYLNSLSFWLTFSGAMLINISLAIGHFAGTGWVAYPPLSELHYSPGVGVDYYIWALQIAGIGTTLSAVNFFVTILRMRCPGMTLMKMPVFVWSTFAAMILVILSFPILTVTLGLLFLDRFMGMHFFTTGMGGNQMMYVNLIWAWGHPEVYILMLPGFGIFSEIAATFSQKKLFGYSTMVVATLVITFLSFIVWLHHFYTMGASADVNAFFGIMTMLIAIPTGVKIFNWLFTIYRGKLIFDTPALWMIGFLIVFTIGGMTGVMLAIPALDFELHNSLFLIAHFHTTIIGGVLFAYLAGFTYWFPKAFGFKLNERLGKCAFWCWIVGFFLAFTPLYILGGLGMTRRLSHYAVGSGWHPYLIVAAIGACVIGLGVVFQVLQILVSIKNRKQNRVGNDPWNGRTLEWSIPSPPPFYNFAVTPEVKELDDFWRSKQEPASEPVYQDIHMPKNTGVGFVIGIVSIFFGFAMIWHIHWLAIVSLVVMIASMICRAFDEDTDYNLTADEVRAYEQQLQGGAA